jgi:capsular polysaccharide biosynthesis protein
MTNGTQDFSISDIIRTIRRQWKVVVGVPLVVTVGAVVFSLTLRDTYQAEGTIEIGRVMEYPLEPPSTVLDRMSSKSFLADVGRELGYKDTAGALQNMVTIESIFSESRDRAPTRGVKIIVQTDDPVKSENLCRAVMYKEVAEHNLLYKASWEINYEYLQNVEEDIAKVEAQIDRGYEEIGRLASSGRVNQVEMSYLASYVEEKESYILHLAEVELDLKQGLLMGIYTHPTRVIVEPVVPVVPSGPHRLRLIVLAFVISFALGLIIAFFFDRLSAEKVPAGSAGEDEKKKEFRVTPPPEPEPAPEPAAEPPPRPSEPPAPEPSRTPPREVQRLSDQESLTLSDFLRVLRSQAWIVGVTLVLGLILGVVYALVKPREYKTDFVISTGIVGDHWLHSPMIIEEQCMSRWYLNELSNRLQRKYDVFELEDMIEAELIMTPTKGLTRELRITVKADSPDGCYALATNLALMLEDADEEAFRDTHEMYESYLADLERVMTGLAGAPPGEAEPSALAPGLAVYPPDELTEYRGGPQAYSLFSRSIPYEDNPYLLSSLALFQQVYVDTYIKTRSSVFSQPTTVVVPPLKPTQPEGPGPVSIVLIVLFVSSVLGITLAAVSYRLRQGKGPA